MKTKNLGTYLLFAILGGILTWSILNQPIVEVDIKSYELKIQLLESKIDSVRSINNVLKQEADSLTTKLTTYDTQIDKLNSKIYVIKKQTQVKLDAVDNFGDDELERFFADRYRQSKDSIN
jgi:hypothetical protein|tara:strand:- start:7459 stop:7821 length:363 start_codon:yes stop_codon:yes gene_type:complete